MSTNLLYEVSTPDATTKRALRMHCEILGLALGAEPHLDGYPRIDDVGQLRLHLDLPINNLTDHFSIPTIIMLVIMLVTP